MSDTQTTSPADVAPFAAVVGLLATFPDGSQELFSGALISPTEVLTAAHGVWSQGIGAAVSVVALPFGVPQYTALGGNDTATSCGPSAGTTHTDSAVTSSLFGPNHCTASQSASGTVTRRRSSRMVVSFCPNRLAAAIVSRGSGTLASRTGGR